MGKKSLVPLSLIVAAAYIVHGSWASAYEKYSPYWIGANFSMGASTAVGELWDEELVRETFGQDARQTAMFSLGLGAELHWYFMERYALSFGFGILTKGNKIEDMAGGRDPVSIVNTIVYLEFPVGLVTNFSGFQVGAAMALWIATSRRTKSKYGNGIIEEANWSEDEWNYLRGANFGPKVSVGYAAIAGDISIVPSFEFSVHILSDSRDPDEDGKPPSSRYMNFMGKVALFFI